MDLVKRARSWANKTSIIRIIPIKKRGIVSTKLKRYLVKVSKASPIPRSNPFAIRGVKNIKEKIKKETNVKSFLLFRLFLNKDIFL